MSDFDCDSEIKPSYQRAQEIVNDLEDLDSKKEKIRLIQLSITSAEHRGIEKGKEIQNKEVPH